MKRKAALRAWLFTQLFTGIHPNLWLDQRPHTVSCFQSLHIDVISCLSGLLVEQCAKYSRFEGVSDPLINTLDDILI